MVVGNLFIPGLINITKYLQVYFDSCTWEPVASTRLIMWEYSHNARHIKNNNEKKFISCVWCLYMIEISWNGSTHSRTHNSFLWAHLDNNELDGYLLGDSAYTCRKCLLILFLKLFKRYLVCRREDFRARHINYAWD